MDIFSGIDMKVQLNGNAEPFEKNDPFQTEPIERVEQEDVQEFEGEGQSPSEEEDRQEDEDADFPQEQLENTTDDDVKSKEEDAEEAKKRAEHETAEAKRKEEWDAKQQAKKAGEQEQLNRLAAMTDDEIMTTSMSRVSGDTEKLTRRNMKECVSEHIQTKCLEEPAFARLVMYPRKTMIRCFQYINRKAREFVEQEMKDNGINPEEGIRHGAGVYAYGSDIPDGMCYQWAEDYFRDPEAPEDEEKEEKFVPKPYNGKTTAKPKAKKAAGKKTPKEAAKRKEDILRKQEKDLSVGQLSMLDYTEAMAG